MWVEVRQMHCGCCVLLMHDDREQHFLGRLGFARSKRLKPPSMSPSQWQEQKKGEVGDEVLWWFVGGNMCFQGSRRSAKAWGGDVGAEHNKHG